MKPRKSLSVSLVALCAALYAVLGYLTYLGLFAPVIGTVRFWPSVFVPATFAVAFSPLIGGLGAAIGIFISDMAVHGNPLLSLSVGVPANFLGFYAVGAVYRLARDERRVLAGIAVELVATVLALSALYYARILDESFVVASAVALAFTVAPVVVARQSRRIVFAGSTGLMLGSAIIGVGVWAYSQFFVLPTGQAQLPAWAALVWFVWTYLTEIPFIALFVPPTVRVLEKAGLVFEE